MAAIPIYIVGTITTAAPKSGEVDPSGIKQCVIHGLASIEGLSVGGGPIYPPPGGEKPPQPPVGIWPGPGPIYPIMPHPEHPIVLPPSGGGPPTEPPTEPPTQPPSSNWEWVWSPIYGWHPGYVPGDKPQPPPV